MKKCLRIFGVLIMLLSLTLGTLVDCSYFENDAVQLPVFISFVGILLSIFCLSCSENIK